MPDWKKVIEAKIALAKRGALPSKPSADARVPPGQKLVTNFPILDLGILPEVNKTNWTLRIHGLVQNEISLDWEGFEALPQITDISDFHCVTRWSKLDVDWQGVSARELLMMANPLETAKFVTPGCTTAIRSRGSSLRILFSRFMAITTPASIGREPPDKLVPEPRATKGTRYSWQSLTVRITSSFDSTSTTTSGLARNAVKASDS